MAHGIEVSIGLVVFTALAGLAVHRWRQERRSRRVERWVKEFLSARYGRLPEHLTIGGSGDRLWPVLVAFDGPLTGARHRLQFACPGQQSTLSLLSEKEDKAPEADRRHPEDGVPAGLERGEK